MESRVRFTAVDMPEVDTLTVHILAAVAEKEAKMISTRTKDALTAAKARGVTLGTPATLPSCRGRTAGGDTRSRSPSSSTGRSRCCAPRASPTGRSRPA
ncbi:recombinase family protein [Deinococcus yunweiensis]|uniref:recombinase family protein n=1 Tax=Deinococcus yunweiensis TaxID=367282 RepID=UPI00398E3D2B